MSPKMKDPFGFLLDDDYDKWPKELKEATDTTVPNLNTKEFNNRMGEMFAKFGIERSE